MILNRKQAKEFNISVPYVHISITDLNSDFVKLPDNQNRIDLLQIKFDDIEKDQPEHGYYTITKEQAEKIYNFIQKYKDKCSLFVCNCDGGMSRSAGIAVAICRIFGIDTNKIYATKFPNSKVVNMIMEIHYKRTGEIK